MVVIERMRAREVLLAALNVNKDQEGHLTICAKATLGIPQPESCYEAQLRAASLSTERQMKRVRYQQPHPWG